MFIALENGAFRANPVQPRVQVLLVRIQSPCSNFSRENHQIGQFFACFIDVIVRVIKKPTGTINGIELRHYQLGHTYDLDPSLADYLVVEGFAVVEMRQRNRSQRFRPNDRRRHG